MPLESLEQQAFLALVRTQSHLGSDFERLFREHGLSAATYNTLGVLKAAGVQGRKCQDIGEHLVAVTPDVTRLIDRLQASGLCARVRSKTDRRVVMVRITQAGLDLLSRLDGPVRALHARQLGHLSREQLRTLIDLLAACRAGVKDGPDGRTSL